MEESLHIIIWSQLAHIIPDTHKWYEKKRPLVFISSS